MKEEKKVCIPRTSRVKATIEFFISLSEPNPELSHL